MPISPDTAVLFRHLLVGDFARLAVGIVGMAIGFASLLLQAVRWKSPDRIRLWFGLLAVVYGYRALLMTDSATLFLSRSAIDFQIALVTFTIGMPAVLFGWALVNRKHNWVTKSLLTINVLMALLFLVQHSNAEVVGALYIANNIFVVGFTVAMIVFLFRLPPGEVPDLKTLRIVMLVWGVFVVYNNIRGLLPFPHSADYEFVGFALFLCSLAYLVARRAQQTEDALASIRNELEIARRIQSSILPEEMPRLSGLSVAAKYVPMTDVAGDFYDFLVVDERRIGLLIADVSGHGVPAALVASMVKVAIAAQSGHADNPAQVIAGLNSILTGKMQGQFVTAAYLYLDLENGTASYSAAGHPPLLHYRAAANTVDGIVENGLILGVLPFAAYEAKPVTIAPGDRFLLYTDGVVEAARNGEEFGEDRLKAVLAGALDADSVCQSVIHKITDWTAGVAGDDITIMAVNIQ